MKKFSLESFEQFKANNLDKVKGGVEASEASEAAAEAKKKDKTHEIGTVQGNCADVSKDGVSEIVDCVE